MLSGSRYLDSLHQTEGAPLSRSSFRFPAHRTCGPGNRAATMSGSGLSARNLLDYTIPAILLATELAFDKVSSSASRPR